MIPRPRDKRYGLLIYEGAGERGVFELSNIPAQYDSYGPGRTTTGVCL